MNTASELHDKQLALLLLENYFRVPLNLANKFFSFLHGEIVKISKKLKSISLYVNN